METKICPKCKTDKSVAEFPKNANKKDGLGTYCSLCQKVVQEKWYQTHQKEHYQRNVSQRKLLRQKLDDFLIDKSCVDCGNNNPLVLEFDHVRGKKINAIATMVSSIYGWETILAEIAKCEIRCANCHRIVTHKRRCK